MTAPYTTNLCPNPSFETVVDSIPQGSLAGYTALPGTVLASTSQASLDGQYSMLVTTDGHQPGDGFVGPMEAFTGITGLCSMQIALNGETGSLLVTALSPAIGGGQASILGQVHVNLSPAWQTVALDGLNVALDADAYVVVWTDSAQVLSFMVDCVQYEPESPHHPFVIGEQLYQNAFTLDGGTVIEGSVELITPGRTFTMVPNPGNIVSGGSVILTLAAPVAAFDDFGMWEMNDPDPAMTYVGWNTANQSTGHSNYNRNWGVFYPPLDYPVSDGSLLWKRAAFMVPGFQYNTVPAGVAENLTAVQAELLPLSDAVDSAPVPAAYDTPRALHVRVKPTRLNYSPNPSFAVSTAGWSALGSATITRDSTVHYGLTGSSGHVTCASGDSVSVTVSGLIAGDMYTCSVYGLPESAHLTDIQLQVAGVNGGVPGATVNALPQTHPDGTQAWVRPHVTFKATASTMLIILAPVSDGTWPVTFGITQNLIEAGEIVGNYFDGNDGNPDYMWEGTAGLSRSYFYEGYTAGQGVIHDILDRNIPVEITAADPEYNKPPTQ